MPIQQRFLDQMIAEGIIHQASAGRYWLDLPAYKTRQKERFTWSMRVLALGIVVFLVILAARAVQHWR